RVSTLLHPLRQNDHVLLKGIYTVLPMEYYSTLQLCQNDHVLLKGIYMGCEQNDTEVVFYRYKIRVSIEMNECSFMDFLQKVKR
ncbi:MAG: hypothetical protein RR961_10330, partial [Eubacterium sp.]